MRPPLDKDVRRALEFVVEHQQEIRDPWFQAATVQAILHLERPTPTHLHWPELDVDLSLDSIAHPERYPLTSKL